MNPEILKTDLEKIEDPATREGMSLLLNLLGELQAERAQLMAEYQQLQDEVLRLKRKRRKERRAASSR